MTERVDSLGAFNTFMWCAAFAGVASVFQTLLEILSEKNDSKKFTRRDYLRIVVQVASVGFYGGLAGWAIQHVFPDARGELLGIASAVLGSGGPKVTRMFLVGVVEKVMNVKVVDKDDGSSA